jgi:hypothetical protein
MDVGREPLRGKGAELLPRPDAGTLYGAVDPQPPVLESRPRRRADGQYRKVSDEVLAGRQPLGQLRIEWAATPEAATDQ